MVSLHEIINLLDKDSLMSCAGLANNVLAAPYKKKLREQLCESQCFYIGNVCSVPSNKYMSMPKNLPFKTCWFEAIYESNFIDLKGKECRSGILAFLIKEELNYRAFGAWHFVKQPHENWGCFNFFQWFLDLENDQIWINIPPTGYPKEYDMIPINLVSNFLFARSCDNVNKIENIPTDPELSKEEQKRGLIS